MCPQIIIVRVLSLCRYFVRIKTKVRDEYYNILKRRVIVWHAIMNNRKKYGYNKT